MSRPLIAVTLGDVSGIGPEIVVRAIISKRVAAASVPVVIGHPAILRRAADLCGLTDRLNVREITTGPASADDLRCLAKATAPAPTDERVTVGCWNPAGDAALTAAARVANAAAGDAAFHYLIAAIELARQGTVSAIATAPLNKEALHLAGHHFPGHTEILAQQCGVDQFGMMLYLPESAIQPLRSLVRAPSLTAGTATRPAAADGLSIVHVTLHTSIASVPALLTTAAVCEKVRLMDGFLRRIRCERRAIGVCSLNPHGGENGLFGDEEPRVIAPAVQLCADSHIPVSGPYPVDTLVRRAVAGEFDGLVAMYHDQGHIPVKLIGFDSAVNITLGLPLIRTSPTHGTAFDRAWNPATPADASGMIEAILTAAKLCE
ncbi:MAG: 4-hydroxythreonine-4-phosphate dehydrogenase PdxA [Planctomycetaceae bacterium]